MYRVCGRYLFFPIIAWLGNWEFLKRDKNWAARKGRGAPFSVCSEGNFGNGLDGRNVRGAEDEECRRPIV